MRQSSAAMVMVGVPSWLVRRITTEVDGMASAMTFHAPTITIAAEDWRILALVDGRSSVADIIGSLGMSAFAVCGVLHRLMTAGAVEATT